MLSLLSVLKIIYIYIAHRDVKVRSSTRKFRVKNITRTTGIITGASLLSFHILVFSQK